MAERHADVLVIGAGVAGAACATQLREEGFDGSILLVGREADPPYHRPPVSKGYLTGAEARDAALFHPPGWYERAGVELLTRTSVTRLDAAGRLATLSTREAVSYERALLATGANVRRLAVDGAGLEGIHYLRTLRNADALRADVAGAERVVLVGGSFIATEVAAALASTGTRCAIVMLERRVLERSVGERVGEWAQGLLEGHGVEVHGGRSVARLEGDGERVARVVCEDGLALEADAVVIGAGAVPDVMLARGAGLELGETGGVRCDATLRTSAPGLWAAGDLCEYDSVVHGRRLRVEHWDVAIEQGRHVARAMLGSEAPYAVVPYFFSDLADWATIEQVGPAAAWEEERWRGSPREGSFSVLYLAGGRVVAGLAVGRPEDLEEARALVRAGGAPPVA